MFSYFFTYFLQIYSKFIWFLIEFNQILWSIIELIDFEWIILEFLFFSNFGVRHVASQRFFHENQHVCVFWDHIVIVLHFFEIKKTLSYGPFGAKLRGASFVFRKNMKTWQSGPKKHKHVDFREKTNWEATCLIPKLEKNKCPDIIYSKLINSIIYNQI